MDVSKGYVKEEPNAKFSRPNVAAIVTADRTLFIQAETGGELDEWKAALTEALTGRPPVALHGRAGSGGARGAPARPTPPMPAVLDIDGVMETGAELRVRAAGNLLDALCVAWFRVAPGSDLPAARADPAKCPGVT